MTRFRQGDLLVDRYQIENYHAEGGMQEVYLCFDRTLGRRVILKTPKEGVQDRRFRRGAEMGARVNHPNIAATLDYFEDDDITFLVEEFVEGSDLGKRLHRDFHFLDPALAAHVVHHVARALKEAHRVEICHRDLKPSNIMTSDDLEISTIKLTDFGIAKLALAEIESEIEEFHRDQATLTSSNTLLGAVPYMAPECWANWRDAGQPMDVWALGCVAFHLLAGHAPFGEGRVAIANVIRAETAGAVTLTPPAYFGRHPPTQKLEEELWEIIMACLAIDPAGRPSASDIVARIEGLCYPVAPRRSATISTFPTRYASGGTGNFGFMADEEGAHRWFFHGTDFFGTGQPAEGTRVSFSVYPGIPQPRCAPVLALK